jgi:4-aminobutyrate aminotransferase-like enzyme/Ser/Thr protein kinase RdoA (MazF antagonist)
MLQLHDARPGISEDEARRILADQWGIAGQLRALPGERDRNFHVRAGDGSEFVLKITSPDDDAGVLDLQHAALSHIASRGPAIAIPRPVATTAGPLTADVQGGSGRRIRLLTWIPGRPLAGARPHSPALLRHLGESLGAIGRALADFDHPSARRRLKWDLAAAEWIGEHLPRIADPTRRGIVERVVQRYVDRLRPALGNLRASVVHNDANDHNVIVAFDPSGSAAVSGIVDFGDVLRTNTVCDLAIALAYAMMGKPDPLAAAVHAVAGYHAVLPLEADELRVLLPLVRTRLAVSVVNAVLQREASPANAYLQVSEVGAWRLLEQLELVHDRFAEYRFRDACGLTPCPDGEAVSRWIEGRRGRFAPVVGYPLDTPNVHLFDLDVAGSDAGTADRWRDLRRFTGFLFDQLRDVHAKAGIGRYDEVRPIYTTELFRVAGNDGPEWRTVHTAIDVFLPAGAGVYAPLAGTVHSLRDNRTPGDYGPTIILEHRTDDGPTFWTLYGHLSRESLARLGPGASLGAGDIVGYLGDEGVNGGWPPHLHFQIIADLLGRSGDFPGVSTPGERETWLSISPDPTPLLGLPARARAPRAEPVHALRARRDAHLGKSLSVAYRRPLHIVRGFGQHLLDAEGRRYLDAVNNVAHVGHAHPDVVRAGQRRLALLNTNTRYLHEDLLRYAERLAATLPPPLEVCFFVCSGSEANELALRLARTHTGERDLIVIEAGYHGNTTTLVDVSPYKFDGPGGAGAPSWVHKVPMPDVYRGAFRGDDDEAGLKYAQAVCDAVGRIRQSGRRPAAFLAESLLSCGGQIVLPAGYLAESYRHTRAAGGVCIADEVQVGFGRVGSDWWGFETQGVVPDIVTMGKPIGNGHPLGAVVTTPEIAASFANGMEYFNTFGGNPVSCAIGLAVLDVIEREGLRASALRVGTHLMQALRTLMTRHALIGDVRGLGLFIGVELVVDRDRRIPAPRQASYVANRMRDGGVLLSTDGPDHNVLKIKPPLVFTERDADFLVETLDRVLCEDPAQPRE